MMRRSGLQGDVLSLYRKLLRAARIKDATVTPVSSEVTSTAGPDTRLDRNDGSTRAVNTIRSNPSSAHGGAMYQVVRTEFRGQALSIPRTDFRSIEHYLRFGHKKLKLLGMKGVQAASVITTDNNTA